MWIFRRKICAWGLVEASQGKIGNVVDQILLYCYHYDPATGKYGAVIVNILRLSAAATILILGGFLLIMIRMERSWREERRTAGQHESGDTDYESTARTANDQGLTTSD